MSTDPEVKRFPVLYPTRTTVQMCQVLSLRSIYTLAPALRGRLNGLFVAFAFLGGATGSGLAPAVYVLRGWTTVGGLGALFVLAALAYYSTEVRKQRP